MTQVHYIKIVDGTGCVMKLGHVLRVHGADIVCQGAGRGISRGVP
jgi:hypothetical protein